MKRFFALMLVLALLLCGCSQANETAATTVPTEVTTQPTEVTTEPPTEPSTQPTEPAPVDTNPLTGEVLDEESDVRPIAIMINNHSLAAPQNGLGGADIVYEVLAEGSITRFMAIFTDLSDVDVIGPVRSLRPYYFRIAESYDAILISAGGSEEALSLGADYNAYANALLGKYGNYFYRDSWRKSNKGYEHSLMTTGENVEKLAAKFRTTQLEGMDYNLDFDDSTIPSGDAAVKVTLKFYNKSTVMTYHADTNLYTMYQHGADQKDPNTDEPVAFRNLIILEASTKTIDSYGRLSVQNTGSGDGYLVRDGVIIPIRWSRADNDSQYSYTDLNGDPITLGVGKTYVGIVPKLDACGYSG